MTTTSRRAVLAGIAATPALTVPALADHPDAQLFALYRKLTEAIARRDNLSDACSVASDRAQAIKATMPPLPDEPEPPSEFAQIWTHEPGRVFDMLSADHPLKIWERNTAAERQALYAQQYERRHFVNERAGVTAAEAAFNNAVAESNDIGAAICEINAQTINGVLVKIKTCEALDFADDPEEFWTSIAADIRRIAGADGTAVQS
jgi:hypothetical protein